MTQETFADRLKEAMAEKSLKQSDLIHLAAAQGEKLGTVTYSYNGQTYQKERFYQAVF